MVWNSRPGASRNALHMLVLIEDGEVFDPRPLGRTSVLIDDERIIKVGHVDRDALDRLDLEYEVLDAAGRLVVPGLIDPHQHLLGGSGEGSLARQTPMIFLSELIQAGVTTVVGLLGVDTTMKTMAGLLARVKALNAEGLSARMWSGGYNVPPTTVMSSLREDIMFIDEVIGAGEVAISDHRSLAPTTEQLARVVLDTHVGGLLSGKAGITHFHIGESDTRLRPLTRLVDEHDIDPGWLYPTHVTRSERLLEEAAELARAGAWVDMDTVEPGIGQHVRGYLDAGGPLERLTLSSDAGSNSPETRWHEVRDCVLSCGFTVEQMLPLVTSNVAEALKLDRKGRLAPAMDGDVLLLDAETLELECVVARGKIMMRDGAVVATEEFVPGMTRRFALTGGKDDPRMEGARAVQRA